MLTIFQQEIYLILHTLFQREEQILYTLLICICEQIDTGKKKDVETAYNY